MKALAVVAVLLGIFLVAAVASGVAFALSKRSASAGAETSAEPALERARKDVEKVGWHVVAIPGEGRSPGFLFTIGLWHTYQHPELILFSAAEDPLTVEPSLRRLVERIRSGEKLEPGKRFDAAFNNFPAQLREVSTRWFPEFLGLSGAFYGSFDFPVLQVFWPDKAARFPWEAEFNRDLFGAQPALSETNLVLARLPSSTLDVMEQEQGLVPIRAAVVELLVREEPRKLEAALEEWRWLIGRDAQHLATTVFGDVLLREPSGAVSVLFTGESEYF